MVSHARGIQLHTGVKIAAIDRARTRSVSEAGARERYDRLLLATGSTPFKLPIPGVDLTGVITYRDIADTEAMIAAAKSSRHAVVIGGGLLGLEAANRSQVARHGRDRAARDAVADGTAARLHCGGTPAAIAGGARYTLHARRTDDWRYRATAAAFAA